MNITFLLRLWPVYGGGETVTICLANEMIKRGWNVSVLYFKNNTRPDLPFIDPAVKAVQIPDIRCDEFTTRFPDADKVTSYLKGIYSGKRHPLSYQSMVAGRIYPWNKGTV